ncbi:terminase small subunit [Escherichia coli]
MGKSAFISMLINWGMSTCEDCKVVVTANTDNQLRTKTWPEIIKWSNLAITKDWFTCTATAMYSNDPGHDKRWRADAIPMMRDERIQKRIAELMEERNKRMRVSADYVLMRLVEIDQMDVIDILNDDGSLKPIREWPKIWRTTLSGFDLSSTIMNMNEDSIETILKKIKWPDKVKNLELIGKHVDVNAFKERLDVNVNVTIADRIAAARKRLKERQDGNQ